MKENEEDYLAPCIVNEGTVINKRDMMRALRIFERIYFEDYVDGKMISSGEGVLVDVFQCQECSSLFLNGAVFINVMSFDYLQLDRADDKTVAKLVNKFRTIKMNPLSTSTNFLIDSQAHMLDCFYDEELDETHLLHEEPFEDEE